jgi:tRNA A37 threonylcarbamoyladenosine biosynthesis protein TsaE
MVFFSTSYRSTNWLILLLLFATLEREMDASWSLPGSAAFNRRLLHRLLVAWPEPFACVCVRGACGSGKSRLIADAIKNAATSGPENRLESPAARVVATSISSLDVFRHEFHNNGTALVRCLREVCERAARSSKGPLVIVAVMEHAEMFLTLNVHIDGQRTYTHAGFVMDLVDLQESLLVLDCLPHHPEIIQRLVLILECTDDRGSEELSATGRSVLNLNASEITSLFDVVIATKAPVEAERMDFFRQALLSSGSGLCTEEWLGQLASKTGGIHMRGLSEVALICAEHLSASSSETAPPPPIDAVLAAYLASGTHSCLMTRASAGYADIQKTLWSDIVGLEDVKAALIDLLSAQVKNSAIYRHHGVRPRAGVLLYGPPGTGKTMLARAMATELHASFVYLDLPQLIHAEVGESERVLDEFFAAARLRSPCVMFIDEIQAAFGLRGSDGHSAHDARLVSYLLQQLDQSRHDDEHTILFVGATNVVHLLDPALLLPGRLDVQILVPPPDGPAREAQVKRVLVENWQAWRMPADCVDVLSRSFVDLLDGATGAEIANCLNLFGLTVLSVVCECSTNVCVDQIGPLLWSCGALSDIATGALEECRRRLKR